MITRHAIVRAHRLIGPFIRKTPMIEVAAGTFSSVPLSLKLELLQHTGSFKPRGAFTNLLEGPIPKSGVAAASGGNHGAAVAYAARALGHAAHIFVPQIASPVKVAAIRAHGGEVVVTGADYAEAASACADFVARTGARAIHAYDAPPTLAGQGTLAREIDEDTAELDTLLVAVGGGGLIGGIASWFAGKVRLVAVESEGTPTLARALDAGHPVDVEVSGLAADSLGARRIGDLGFAAAAAHVSDALLVSDDQIRAAQRALWRELRLVAEPGGATALAAVIAGAYLPARDERVAVVICGANADPASVA